MNIYVYRYDGGFCFVPQNGRERADTSAHKNAVLCFATSDAELVALGMTETAFVLIRRDHFDVPEDIGRDLIERIEVGRERTVSGST